MSISWFFCGHYRALKSMGPSFVLTSSKQINSTRAKASSQKSKLELCPIFFISFNNTADPQRGIGLHKIPFWGCTRAEWRYQEKKDLAHVKHYPSLASRPYAFEYEENGLWWRHNSVVPTSHKCSVMGQETLLKTAVECGIWFFFDNFFFAQVDRRIIRFRLAKSIFGV